jgi:cell division protein FtsZ
MNMMTFDLPTDQNSIIKVIGVGGGGSNAVNHMYRQGIKGVDFIVCNTDQQALDISPVPTKIALGASLTKGRGAGSMPEVGRNAAIENIDEIKKLLGNDTQMVFITAGMGGGTGTGAAPIIAQAAQEMGILTVGIVTVPFSFEGKKRKAQAEAGMEELKKYVDTLLVICNEKLREIYGNLKLGEAFGHADDILTTAAKGIADIITTTMHINTDFADISTVMKGSGVAIMGTAMASGEGRATKAVEQAMHSPLLNDNNIKGARYVLLNIMCGKEEITMDELGEVTDFIQDAAGQTAEIIKGYGIDETLGDNVKITLIATGFNNKMDAGMELASKKPEKKMYILTADEPVSQLNPTVVPAPEAVLPPIVTGKIVYDLNGPVTESSMEESSNAVTLETPTEPFLKEEKQVTIEFDVVNNIMNPLPDESVSEIKAETNQETASEITAERTPESPSETTLETWIESSVTSSIRVQAETIVNEEPSAEKIQEEEQRRKAQERILKLKELSFKLKTPGGITELENEPAYRRRNIDLDSNSPAHSSESQLSRYTISENDDKKAEIKPNNSFLHDNVD